FVVCYVSHFAVMCVVISALYRAHLRRAALAIIPNVAAGVFALLLAFGIRWYACEAFVIPTNAMAPTLLGEHWEAPCPQCGAPAYGSAIVQSGPTGSSADAPFPPEGLMMVCSKEKTAVYVKNKPQKRGTGDRIVACKLLPPRRWDLIVFRYPSDPSVCYVK